MADVQAPELKAIQDCGFKDEGEWRKRGERAFGVLKEQGALQGLLVELGCSGHLPAMLKKEAPEGIRYHGIGLIAPILKWCGEAFQQNGAFAFSRIDIRDPLRNPNGSVIPEKMRLPFDDATVDTVYVDVSFTTISQSALRRYMSEISRVLKTGGRMIAFFYLLDGTAMVRISQRRTKYTFEHRLDTYCRAQDPKRPGAPIAYNDTFIKMLGAPVHLDVKHVANGAWAGHENATAFEDLVVLEKLEAPEEPKK